jgi:hypothetical protein
MQTSTSQSQSIDTAAPMIHTAPGQVPRRRFGRHDEPVSIIGIGGAALAGAESYEEAERIAHDAIDAGINFFDNALGV